ncbi:ComEC/Rec2 family competence protein [Cytophaga sp. FL35]|uniref:ComEC/Rec2 family competence protein n=1 Tax=Cytophaga sp. FL35 TaxID=1904456 RepID=UPI0016534570|nr:ComEC/Rec2 family competence protein [Cytophaga sp. FL35]MBC6998961.1 ComEC/Rec2 family competence protein [Cytophaga sp. FL35]
MRLLRFIPIKLTFFLIIGIVLGDKISPTIIPSILVVAISLVVLWILFRNHKTTSVSFGILACLTTCGIGILAISMANPINQPNHYSHFSEGNAHTLHLKIREVLKPTAFSNRFVAEVESVDEVMAEGRLLLSTPLDSNLRNFKVDAEILYSGKLTPINGPLNPHQFNYQKYMSHLGIHHQIRLDENNHVTTKNPDPTFLGRVSAFRSYLIEKLKLENFGDEELGVIQALLLGQRDDILTDTYENYKNAGAVHILAVSGLHVGILLLIIQFILKPIEAFSRGKTIKLICTLLLLWGFALLAGFSASVVRAVTMFSFFAYAIYINRPNNTFNILALSMFFILLVINPRLLFQVGFQMSYAAVAAIVWIFPLLQNMWYPKNKVLKYLWQLLSVSIAAQAGVLPISLFYFHQFPGLFFISNLLIIPTLGIILGMGLLVLFLASINLLPSELTSLYNVIIGYMNKVVAWVAQQESFIFKNISFDAVQLILSYGILFLLILFLSRTSFRKFKWLAVFILGMQAYSLFALYRTKSNKSLLIAHKTANTLLLHQEGATLNTFASNQVPEKIITDYQVAERIEKVTQDSLANSYQWKGKNILIVDSTAVYISSKEKIDYLVLTQSPKLNLNRLIDSIQPQKIIADGSNYRSYVKRWKKTCQQRKLPFHYTGEKGAYYFE